MGPDIFNKQAGISMVYRPDFQVHAGMPVSWFHCAKGGGKLSKHTPDFSPQLLEVKFTDCLSL
jgi:hypothetical protein